MEDSQDLSNQNTELQKNNEKNNSDSQQQESENEQQKEQSTSEIVNQLIELMNQKQILLDRKMNSFIEINNFEQNSKSKFEIVLQAIKQVRNMLLSKINGSVNQLQNMNDYLSNVQTRVQQYSNTEIQDISEISFRTDHYEQLNQVFKNLQNVHHQRRQQTLAFEKFNNQHLYQIQAEMLYQQKVRNEQQTVFQNLDKQQEKLEQITRQKFLDFCNNQKINKQEYTKDFGYLELSYLHALNEQSQHILDYTKKVMEFLNRIISIDTQKLNIFKCIFEQHIQKFKKLFISEIPEDEFQAFDFNTYNLNTLNITQALSKEIHREMFKDQNVTHTIFMETICQYMKFGSLLFFYCIDDLQRRPWILGEYHLDKVLFGSNIRPKEYKPVQLYLTVDLQLILVHQTLPLIVLDYKNNIQVQLTQNNNQLLVLTKKNSYFLGVVEAYYLDFHSSKDFDIICQLLEVSEEDEQK